SERTVLWDPDSFKDEHRARLQSLIEKKRRGQKIKAAKPAAEEKVTAAPDLMAALKETLAQSRQRKRKPRELGGLSRDELYQLASERGLKGRSSMNKKELLKALQR